MVERLEREMIDMENRYEHILNEALEAVAGKLELAQIRWKQTCDLVQLKNINKLREFGLPHIEL